MVGLGVSRRRRLNVGVVYDAATAAYDDYTTKDSEERLWTLSMLTMENIKGSKKVCGDRGRSWNNDNRRSQDFSSRPPALVLPQLN